MLPFLAPIVTMLADKGLDLLSGAVEGGADKAIDYISDKTGIDLKSNKGLSSEDVIKLKQFESEDKIALEKLALENKKEDNRHEEHQEKSRTDRWDSDNNSDSRFAKLIRPMLVMYLVIVCTILAIIDGNVAQFTIKDAWVTLFTSLAVTAVAGYFTLRTYEKRTNTSKW